MAALFSTPKIPQEDPETKALREAEQKRAEEDRLKTIQDQLRGEQTRSGAFGLRSLLGPLGTGGALRSLLGSG